MAYDDAYPIGFTGNISFDTTDTSNTGSLLFQLQKDVDSTRGNTTPGAGAAIYSDILSLIATPIYGTIVIGGALTQQVIAYQAKFDVDQGVVNWLVGARHVNLNDNLEGTLIRDYTSQQLLLRFGNGSGAESDAEISAASNNIAVTVGTQILDYGQIPDITTIGVADAGGVAQTVFSLQGQPPDYAGWAGTLLFPYLKENKFFDDWLLNASPFTALASTSPGAAPASTVFKHTPGAYDLIAAIVAGHNATFQAGLTPGNFGQAIAAYLGNSEGVTADPTPLIATTNAWFQAYYNLPPVGPFPSYEFQPGSDLIFAKPLTLSVTYILGTLAGETLDERTDSRNVTVDPASGDAFYGDSMIVGGPGGNVIYGHEVGHDLIDGGSGNNSIHAGHQDSVIYGGGTGSNIIFGNIDDSSAPSKLEHANASMADPRLGTIDVLVGGGGDVSASDVAVGAAPVAPGKDGNDTFYVASDSNIIVGGNNTNTFYIDAKNYNPKVNIIWGDGGASTYNFTGEYFQVEILYMVNASVSTVDNLKPSDFGLASQYYLINAPRVVIINPNSADDFIFNGVKLTGGSYGPDGYPDLGGDNYLPSIGGFDNLSASTSSVLVSNGNNELNIEGFTNGDFGITLSGDGPANSSSNSDIVDPSFFTTKSHTYITDGGSLLSGGSGGAPPQATGDATSQIKAGNALVQNDFVVTDNVGELFSLDLPMQPATPDDPDGGADIPDAGGDLSDAQLDPLVIDLTGKGVNLVDRSVASPFYNFTGGNYAQNTSWTGAGTGFLAIKAANGSIQLLGSATQSGFAALQALDANGDGVINASDPGFASLVVWQDLNGDGVAEAGEVESLAQLGIVSISLTETAVRQTIGDSTVIGTAKATMADGTKRTVAEADLNISSVYTKYVGSYTPNPVVAVLPDLRGYGTLPDLAISASQDSGLLTLVQQLTATDPSDTAAFDAATRAVLFRWAGVDTVAPASGNAFDGQELGFLQQLLGNTVEFGVGTQQPLPWFIGQSNLLQTSWDAAFSGLKARLLVQLPGSPFAAAFQVDPARDLVVPTGPLCLLTIAEQAPQGTGQDAIAYWINALDVINASVADLGQVLPLGTSLLAGLQATIPSYFSPAIISAVATGTLSFVEGTALAGRLAGTPGSDLFVVEQHKAVLTGLGGGDEFVVGTGLGSTEINETDNSSSPDNTLLLNGILPSQVVVSGDASGDIILTLSTGDTVKLDNMLAPSSSNYLQAEGHATITLSASTSYGVQSVVFGDGTVWTAQQVIQMELSASANPGTTLYGTAGSDLLDGQGLKAVLQGNGGSDTFVFDTGYGRLEINQHQNTATDDSVLRFGLGIAASDVAATTDSSGDLILTIGSNGDRVTVDNMLGTPGAGVQAIDFADGTAWSPSQAFALATTGTPGSDELYGTPGPDLFDGKGGGDYEQGNGGGDTFLFNQGYGALEINEHDQNAADVNLLRFGSGIAPGSVQVSGTASGNILLQVGTSGDQVTLDNALDGPGYGVQSVQFADGTTWTC